MAGPKTHIGVSGKARQVKNIYVGVSGKARKIRKAYAGVSGKARLVYSADWWLPSGVAAANCLAAYQFKGAASEAAARTDLTGHGYTLSKWDSLSWSSANGFERVSGNSRLSNTTLCSKNIRSFAIKYSNHVPANNGPIVEGGGSSGFAVLFISGLQKDGGKLWDGTESSWTTVPIIPKNNNGEVLKATSNASASGVIGVTAQTAIYMNGTAMGVKTEGNDGTKHGPWPNSSSWLIWIYINNFYVHAAAFFDVNLTAAQHKELYTMMSLL